MEQKFYECEKCGFVVGVITGDVKEMTCNGEKMKELTANTTDAAQEKHIPVVEVKGNRIFVTVGSVMHPMTEEHSISWVYLRTSEGGHRKSLMEGKEPKVEFLLTEQEKALEVFAYCNLHGLWKKEIG